MDTIILGIESSCDDTAAAISSNTKILANIVAGQEIHEAYGGVVPELAARAHHENIIPVVHETMKAAGINKEDIQAVAFTKGPGLIGPLLVGSVFAKSFAMGLNIPILEVHHIHAHVMAHFIENGSRKNDDHNDGYPQFPFLCLTVSGGHTQIIKVSDHLKLEIIGETLDDAAGEAFDKTAKLLGLVYPGGPLIDKYAQEGDPERFNFPEPRIPELNFSFSGLKTAILYFLQDKEKEDPDFIKTNLADICASVQKRITTILMNKLILATEQTGIQEIAIAGGVSANSALRLALAETGDEMNWNTYIPKNEFCTDNAAMVSVTGYYKYLKNEFTDQNVVPDARYKLG